MKIFKRKMFQPATNNEGRQNIYNKIGLRKYSRGTKYINYLVKYWVKNPNDDISFNKINKLLKEYSNKKNIDIKLIKRDIHKELKHLELTQSSNRKYLQKISVYLVQDYDFIGDKKLITEIVRGIINNL